MLWAMTVLGRGEVVRACSEEPGLGSEGRVGGERRKEFLRIPRDVSDGCCSVVKQKCTSLPFGRWVGEEICMVGETCAMLGVDEKDAANQKSPSKPVSCMEE